MFFANRPCIFASRIFASCYKITEMYKRTEITEWEDSFHEVQYSLNFSGLVKSHLFASDIYQAFGSTAWYWGEVYDEEAYC